MNKTEQLGFKYLVESVGIEPSKLAFHPSSSPDFTTSDGRGFEVKRAYYKTIQISDRQWESLTSHPNCFILVFDKNESPDVIIPMNELPIGTETWGNYNIRQVIYNIGAIPRRLFLELVAKYGTQHNGEELKRIIKAEKKRRATIMPVA